MLEIIDIVNSDTMHFIVLKEIFEYLRVRLLSGHKQIVRRSIVLVDALIKNCGPNVYVLVAQKHFMRTLSKVSRSWLLKGSQHSKRLGEYGLDTMQAWGEAFEPRKALYPHIYGAYMHLRSKSYITFPRQQYDPTRVPIFLGPITMLERKFVGDFTGLGRNQTGSPRGDGEEHKWGDYSEYDSPQETDLQAESRGNGGSHVVHTSGVDPLSMGAIPPPPPPRRLQRLSSPIEEESHSSSDLVDFSSDDSMIVSDIGLRAPAPPVDLFDSATSQFSATGVGASAFEAAFGEEISHVDDVCARQSTGQWDAPLPLDPFLAVGSTGEAANHSHMPPSEAVVGIDVGLQCDLASSEDILNLFPRPSHTPGPATTAMVGPPGYYMPPLHTTHQQPYPEPSYHEQVRHHAMMLHQLENIAGRPPPPPPPPRPSTSEAESSVAVFHEDRLSHDGSGLLQQQLRQRRESGQFFNPSSDPHNRVMYFGNTRLVRREL